MDSKKVIEKLVKIAETQQKVIQKLAQQAGLQPPPTALRPATPTHNVLGKLQEVAPQLMALVEVAGSKQLGNELHLKFKPGATQATLQGLLAKLQELTTKNEVAGGPFTIKPV